MIKQNNQNKYVQNNKSNIFIYYYSKEYQLLNIIQSINNQQFNNIKYKSKSNIQTHKSKLKQSKLKQSKLKQSINPHHIIQPTNDFNINHTNSYNHHQYQHNHNHNNHNKHQHQNNQIKHSKRFKTQYHSNIKQNHYQNHYNHNNNQLLNIHSIKPSPSKPNLIIQQSFNDTKNRFNYLNDLENQIISNQNNQSHPYDQYLSFQPSKPYTSNQSKPFQSQHSNKLKTTNDIQHYQYPNHQNHNNYYLPNYKSLSQNNHKSRSFYLERNQQFIPEPNNVYKSVFNPKNNDKLSSIKAMRHSLDLRDKSLDLQNITKNIRKQSFNFTKSKKLQKMYTQQTQQIYDPYYESKDMFLRKLDKLKLWSKQATSQNTTQRQALRQIPVKNDYIKSLNTPIQTIIKQNSTIMHQRKNLLTFNLNNQMIQKNILKLQKTSENRIKQNGINGLSQIMQRKQSQSGRINDAVYNGCKKALNKY